MARSSEGSYAAEYNASIDKPRKFRRHILHPYEVNGYCVRYSVGLRFWIVNELHYFKKKQDAFNKANSMPRGNYAGE